MMQALANAGRRLDALAEAASQKLEVLWDRATSNEHQENNESEPSTLPIGIVVHENDEPAVEIVPRVVREASPELVEPRPTATRPSSTRPFNERHIPCFEIIKGSYVIAFIVLLILPFITILILASTDVLTWEQVTVLAIVLGVLAAIVFCYGCLLYLVALLGVAILLAIFRSCCPRAAASEAIARNQANSSRGMSNKASTSARRT